MSATVQEHADRLARALHTKLLRIVAGVLREAGIEGFERETIRSKGPNFWARQPMMGPKLVKLLGDLVGGWPK